MDDQGRPTIWTQIADLDARLRALETTVAGLVKELEVMKDQLSTLVKVGLTVLGGLLAVAVTIALAVGHH